MPSAASAAAPRHRLLWHADDFGYSPSVNAGIARAHREGLVRGASVLAAGAAFEEAVSLAKSMPGLAVGVHLAAVELPALLPPARLGGLASADGRLPAGHLQFLLRYAAGRVPVPSLEAEWDAQIARVRDAGLRPAYLDSHQHLHVLPALFGATLRLARRHGIRAVRTPGDAVPGEAGPLRLGLLAGLFALGTRARGRARGEGFASADGTLGIADAGRLDAARVLRLARGLLRRAPGTWELVSHPGLGEPPGSPAARWGYHWRAECDAACDPAVAEGLREMGIQVVEAGSG